MYNYEETSFGVAVMQKRHATGFVLEGDEVFLQGDEATDFLRKMNRARQKEQSKRRNPDNMPICQNLMAEYCNRG
jgi:hypothetical protein